jgi:excisionase family DNA binding protein
MKLLKVREAARLANVHPETVRRWVRRGLLPVVRIPGRGSGGKEFRIVEDELIEFLQLDQEREVKWK